MLRGRALIPNYNIRLRLPPQNLALQHLALQILIKRRRQPRLLPVHRIERALNVPPPPPPHLLPKRSWATK